jgi:hypothetical protein
VPSVDDDAGSGPGEEIWEPAGGVAAASVAAVAPPELWVVPAALVLVAAVPVDGVWSPIASVGLAGVVSLLTASGAAARGADKLIAGVICLVAVTSDAGRAVDTVATVCAAVGTVVSIVCVLTTSGVSTVCCTAVVLLPSPIECAAGAAIAALCGAATVPDCAGAEIVSAGAAGDPALAAGEPVAPVAPDPLVAPAAAPAPLDPVPEVEGEAAAGFAVVSAAVAGAPVPGAGALAGVTLAGVGMFGNGGTAVPFCWLTTGVFSTAFASPDTAPELADGPLCFEARVPVSENELPCSGRRCLV